MQFYNSHTPESTNLRCCVGWRLAGCWGQHRESRIRLILLASAHFVNPRVSLMCRIVWPSSRSFRTSLSISSLNANCICQILPLDGVCRDDLFGIDLRGLAYRPDWRERVGARFVIVRSCIAAILVARTFQPCDWGFCSG
jgi:hypothetical protein